MAQNDFKSFAVGAGANVTSQAEWEALAALVTGFQSGKASSAQINKAIRQASFIAAALAQYTSDKTGGDVLDDGDQAAFITKMAAAFGKDFQPLDATLTALAGLTGAANKLPYFNGIDTAALTDLTAFAREILAQTNADGVLSKLGAGNSATRNVGTTAGTVAAGDDPRIVNAITASSPAACTAWANFNGISPVTIKKSFNISSITRLSTGKYVVTFITPMVDTFYCPSFSIGDGAAAGGGGLVVSMDSTGVTGNPLKTVTDMTIYARSTNNALDCAELNIIVFGGK